MTRTVITVDTYEHDDGWRWFAADRAGHVRLIDTTPHPTHQDALDDAFMQHARWIGERNPLPYDRGIYTIEFQQGDAR